MIFKLSFKVVKVIQSTQNSNGYFTVKKKDAFEGCFSVLD